VVTDHDIQYLDENGEMVDWYTDEDMWTADTNRDEVINEYMEYCYDRHNQVSVFTEGNQENYKQTPKTK